MRYRLQRHDGTDCSATMVPITVLRMVPIQRYRQQANFLYVNLLSIQILTVDTACGRIEQIYLIIMVLFVWLQCLRLKK